MGIQLCLCYLLDGSDLHGENLIACGEFPVIVDLETLSGDTQEYICEKAQKRDREGQAVSEWLRQSVLMTGILPFPVWETEQSNVIMSALHKGGKIKTPFKMPVVHNRHTSDIGITYECIEFELSDSSPCLYDREVSAENYTEEMMEGFRSAYNFILKEMEQWETAVSAISNEEGRMILRHTQQYSMYRFTSYHPEFMRSQEDRLLFLNERYTVGLMNGLSGVGYVLCEKRDGERIT